MDIEWRSPRTPRWRLRATTAAIALAMATLSGCGISREFDASQVATAGYEFGPVKFVIDSSGAVSVSLNPQLVTPMGTFSLGVSSRISKSSGDLIVFRDNRRP